MKIAVAGTGYLGLSIAILLAQHNKITIVDIIPEKLNLISNRKLPIQDDYIEEYLAEKELDLTAILDAGSAYIDTNFVVILFFSIILDTFHSRKCKYFINSNIFAYQIY